MSAYLLDTSAIVAHLRREPGGARVQSLFEDAAARIWVAASSLLELDAAMRSKGVNPVRREEIVSLYGGRIADVAPVDCAAAMEAIRLCASVSERIPAMDALIAGCAMARKAVLVHRDPHYDAIPPELLRVLRLEETAPPGTSPDVRDIVKEPLPSYRTGHHRKKERKKT